jgi:hypothetical protein
MVLEGVHFQMNNLVENVVTEALFKTEILE